MIIESFVKLINQKGYEAVSVQDIATDAMINRATFYAHFKDKQDLYDQIFEKSVGAFTTLLDAEKIVSGNKIQLKKIELLLTKIFTDIRTNKSFFLTMTNGNGNELFRQKLSLLLFEKYQTIFDQLQITENDIEVPIDFIIEYMTSIFVGTVHWWVNSDSDLPPAHMARLMIKLVGNGHLTVLGIEIEKKEQ